MAGTWRGGEAVLTQPRPLAGSKRKIVTGVQMELDAYQLSSASTDLRSDPHDVVLPLLGLAGEVGSLVAEYKKRLRAGESYVPFREEVREDLGDLLWYVAAVARSVDLSLSEIAEANLVKTASLWGPALGPPARYDGPFPMSEQLPRQFTVRMTASAGVDGLQRVRMYLGESDVGDPLDDNTYEEDHYRFHDALHLAHAAVLGWSPVFRRLLKRKRKSEPRIDRVEDGARAGALEEGLTAFVFSEASRRNFFEGATRVDWDMLKTVRRIVAQLEVHDQPPSAWHRAILEGYRVWRALRAHNGGLVVGDLDARTIDFMPFGDG